jgi:hypothetical protein
MMRGGSEITTRMENQELGMGNAMKARMEDRGWRMESESGELRMENPKWKMEKRDILAHENDT